MDKLIENTVPKKVKEKGTPLPEFSYDKITDILKSIEKNGRPKNLSEALLKWTEILQSHMKYDAINYAIFRSVPLEEEQGDFSDKVDLRKLGISKEQYEILRKLFQKLEKIDKESDVGNSTLAEIIRNIIGSLEKEPLSVVQAIMQSPTIQRYLLEDGDFAIKWHGVYEKKSLPELLKNGIGSCKTLSVMSKMILESANIRYGLGIGKIEIIENGEFHVFLRIHTNKGIQEYDPTSIFYKPALNFEK